MLFIMLIRIKTTSLLSFKLCNPGKCPPFTSCSHIYTRLGVEGIYQTRCRRYLPDSVYRTNNNNKQSSLIKHTGPWMNIWFLFISPLTVYCKSVRTLYLHLCGIERKKNATLSKFANSSLIHEFTSCTSETFELQHNKKGKS